MVLKYLKEVLSVKFILIIVLSAIWKLTKLLLFEKYATTSKSQLKCHSKWNQKPITTNII